MLRLGGRILAVCLVFLASTGCGQAAEITLLCAGALETWMKELIPLFEAGSKDHLDVSFQAINLITDRLRKGEVADLAIVSPEQWNSLEKDGKLDPATRVVIAKVAFGVFTRKGGAKPDVSSVEAFKHAVLNARSFGGFDPAPRGPTAIYVAELFDRLGIAAELKPKSRFARNGPELFDLVAKGEADVAVAQISEILAAPGVELIAPMPKEIQGYTIFTMALPATAKQPEAAKKLIAFLMSGPARSLLAAKGLEGP
jgi:molybdate transport system substrate-binding protein